MERVVDKSSLSILPRSLPASDHRVVGSQSRCRVMLALHRPLSSRFVHTLRRYKVYEAAHRFKVAAEPQRRTKEEQFELPDFFEIDKDSAAFELLFESAELLKTARHYEVVFLVHEDHVEQLQDIIQKVKDFIEEKKGTIHRLNDWGMRKLAYKIKKAKRANYILMNFQLDGQYTDEFKSMLDKDERVIRHLVVTMKKAETAETVPPPEFSSIRDEYDSDDEGELEGSAYEDGEEPEGSDYEDEEGEVEVEGTKDEELRLRV